MTADTKRGILLTGIINAILSVFLIFIIGLISGLWDMIYDAAPMDYVDQKFEIYQAQQDSANQAYMKELMEEQTARIINAINEQ